MRGGQRRIEPHGFQQQREAFLLLPLHTIKLRQVIIWLRVVRLPLDPGELFLDVRAGFLIEREIDHVLTPETHGSVCLPIELEQVLARARPRVE